MHKGIVSVFGGSSPTPGTEAYQTAYDLGKKLAEAGYAVATGGYIGTMAAASQGAVEAGGHAIGVTTSTLDKWDGRTGPNPWLTEEIRFHNLKDRQHHLVTFSDALVALPGGIGTLSEITMAWSLIYTGEMPVKPLILFGETWRGVVAQLYAEGDYVRQVDMGLLEYASTPEDIVKSLSNGHK